MAGKNKGGNIEFDLDNDDILDWPDFDFDAEFEEPVDDRNPVTKIAATSLSAVGKAVADPGRIKRALTKTLPGAYSDVAGVGFDAASELKGVFDAGMNEVTKTTTDMQRSLRRTLPKVRGKLPDKLGKVLDKLAGSDYDSGPAKSKEQERAEGISAQLDEILGAQNDQRVEEAEVAEARRVNGEVVSRKRFTSQMAVFGSLDASLRQMRDYNEGIDARWKRKSLELQLHQNYLLSDLVENTSRGQVDFLSRLDAIAKNTGLPEAAKIVAGEEFKRLNQAKLLEQLGQGMYGNLGDYLGKTAKGVRERITTTVADKLRDFRSGFRDVSDMSSDMIQMQSEMGDQDDSLSTIIELGMGAAGDWATDKYGDRAKAKLGGFEGFNKFQGRARNALANGARFLNEEAGKRNTHDGLGGTLRDIGRSLLHQTRLDGSVRNEDLTKGTMPDNFNKNTNRSLIDIIPGLLSRIHHEVVKFRTGDDSVPMIRYDMSSGVFTDSKTMVGRVKQLLVREGQDKYNKEGLGKVVDRIDPDKKLNEDQRKALSRHLVQLNMSQKAFKIKDIANGGQIHGTASASDKAAIRALLAEQYGIDVDGSVKGSVDTLAGHEADIGDMLRGMNNNFSDPTGPIKALIESGYKEELLAAGILINKNGSISIDFNKVTDMRLGEDKGDLANLEQDYSPKGSVRSSEAKLKESLRELNGPMGGRGHPFHNRDKKGFAEAVKEILRGTMPAEQRLPAPPVNPANADPMPGVKFDYAQMGKSVAEALKGGENKPVDVLDKMDKIIIALEAMNDSYNSGYQTMVLEEIMDILTDGRQFTNAKITDDLFIVGGKQMGTEAGLWKDRASRAGNKIRDALSGASSFVRGKASAIQERARGAIKTASDMVSSGSRWLDEQRDAAVDVFVKGWSHPVLEARKLEMNLYRDKLTGKIIKKLSDIKGEVEEIGEDGSVRIALTMEDFKKGLHDRLGRRIVFGSIKGIKDLAGTLADKVTGKFRGLRDTVLNKVTQAKDWVWNKLTGLHDVYVNGEATPRLLKHVLEAGGYFDKATGQVIGKLSDIKGDIVDANGNLVLSLDDMRKGLVDQYGESIKANWLTALTRLKRAGEAVVGLGKRALDGVKKIGKSALEGLKGFGKWAGGLLKGAGRKIAGFFNEDGYSSDILKAQLEVQMSILDQIRQLNPANQKRKVGDADGDGKVDGSWQDILAKREEKKDEENGVKRTEEPEKKDGVMSKLLGLLSGGGLGKLFGKDNEDDGFGLDDAADVADIYDATKGDGRGRRRGRGGRLGRWGNKLKNLGKGAGGLLSRIPGAKLVGGLAAGGVAKAAASTAVGWAVRGAIGAGAVAAGIISAPVALAAGLVIGAGALAWMAYKWYDSSKSRPLQKLRLAQYGFSGDDDDFAKQILGFEEKILKHTKVSKGKVSIGAGGDDAMAAIKDLGHDPEKPGALGFRSFNEWFERRFRPVFAEWMQALANAEVSVSLAKLDDDCKAETKLTILKAVRNAGRSGWTVNSAPVEGMAVLTDESQIEKLADAAQAEFEKEAPVGKQDKLSTLVEAPTAGSVVDTTAAIAATGTAAGTSSGGITRSSVARAALSGSGPLGLIASMALGTVAGRYSPADKAPDELYPKGTLDALRTIRMRAYGLVTLDTNLVNSLIYLEWVAKKKTKVDSNGDGYYDGTLEELIELAGSRFTIGEAGSPSYENFKQWLDFRFIPVWTAFAAAVKSAAGSANPLEAHDRLKADKLYRVAEAIIGAGAIYRDTYTAVWSIPLHPVMGQVANSDSSTVADNMKAIIKSIEKDQLDEIAGEAGRSKSSLLSKTKSFFGGIGDSVKKFFGGGDSSSESTPSGSGGNWFSNMFANKPPAGGTTSGVGGLSSPNRPGGGGDGSPYSAQAGGGVGVNFDPKGGKAGNVNDLPMPTARKGFKEHQELIAAVAKMTGVDAGILAGLMATESNFDSSVKNGKSSATGLGQFISGTWDDMVKKYGHLFGIKPGTSANDPRANALMSVMYMQENAKIIKQTMGKTGLTDVDLYLAHFLGAGNYKKFMQNPDSFAKDLDPAGARSNPSIYFRGGNKGQPVTAREVMQIQGNKQVKNRNHYGPMMHEFLKARGETVDESIFKQQDGVSTTVTLADNKTAPATADAAPGTSPEDLVGPVQPASTVAPTTLPAPDAAAIAAGTAPIVGAEGDKPKESMAQTARAANAGGSDIAAGPTMPPEMAAGPVGPTQKDESQPAQKAQPKPVAYTDPAEQDAQRAAQATAQKTGAAELMSGGVDKLVDIGSKQLAVQAKMLDTLQALTQLTAQGQRQNGRTPGPMSVKAPT